MISSKRIEQRAKSFGFNVSLLEQLNLNQSKKNSFYRQPWFLAKFQSFP